MATTTDAKSDSRRKKKSGPKQQMKKFMGIVNEAAPPETPPKGSHPQVSKGQTPHQNAVSQAVKPPPIAKGGNSKDDLDIDKLQRDFQNIKREMSSDVKSEGSGPLPLTVYDPTLGDAKQMASELDNARNSCERSRENAEKLGNDVAQAQEDLLDWQGRFGLVNNELLQLRSNLDKHVSDKWFQSQWKVLHTRIEAVSDQYFVGRQSRFQGSILSRGKGMRPDKLEIHPSISLTRLTNEHAWYLGSEHMRPLIIQAFIWWVLVNRIFAHMACDEWGFFWAGQSRDLLYHLKRQILPPRPRDWPQSDPVTLQRMEADARNYHTWRATTAMLLVARTSVDKRIKTVQDLIIDLVGDVLQAVSPYIVVPKGTSPGAAEDGFCKQLEAIFVEAIKTDAEMAQQRAWIYCEQWRAHREGDPLWGFACSPDEAEIIQTVDQSRGRRAQATGSCIELIVQPALLRDGNQYGEKYATQQVLCKAKVIAGETTLQCFQHR
ncbi:hypothetical protein IQ06DRAFT_62476 [Phaeosphaeriaceae sp. SRC1lsM3a]|nr:hypothetical protein IQ06DRAFT_62476 [Stagonospora sp. SRC1lsM3a]